MTVSLLEPMRGGPLHCLPADRATAPPAGPGCDCRESVRSGNAWYPASVWRGRCCDRALIGGLFMRIKSLPCYSNDACLRSLERGLIHCLRLGPAVAFMRINPASRYVKDESTDLPKAGRVCTAVHRAPIFLRCLYAHKALPISPLAAPCFGSAAHQKRTSPHRPFPLPSKPAPSDSLQYWPPPSTQKR